MHSGLHINFLYTPSIFNLYPTKRSVGVRTIKSANYDTLFALPMERESERVCLQAPMPARPRPKRSLNTPLSPTPGGSVPKVNLAELLPE